MHVEVVSVHLQVHMGILHKAVIQKERSAHLECSFSEPPPIHSEHEHHCLWGRTLSSKSTDHLQEEGITL